MSVYDTWHEHHWREPEFVEAFEPERTILVLTTASLLPSDTLDALEQRLGPRFRELDELQRVALVTVELEGNVTHARLREMTSKHPREVTLALHGLVQRGLLQSSGQHRSTSYTWPPSLLSDRTKPRRASNSELRRPIPEQGGPNSELSTPMLEQRGSNSERSTTPFEVDTAEWAELERLAAPLHSTKRAQRNVAERVILTLCRRRYLTLDQLARLTKRGTDSLRTRYLNRMVDDGRLRLRYPDTPNHPRQAYTCADSA